MAKHMIDQGNGEILELDDEEYKVYKAKEKRRKEERERREAEYERQCAIEEKEERRQREKRQAEYERQCAIEEKRKAVKRWCIRIPFYLVIVVWVVYEYVMRHILID